jgi:hypothetical protein
MTWRHYHCSIGNEFVAARRNYRLFVPPSRIRKLCTPATAASMHNEMNLNNTLTENRLIKLQAAASGTGPLTHYFVRSQHVTQKQLPWYVKTGSVNVGNIWNSCCELNEERQIKNKGSTYSPRCDSQQHKLNAIFKDYPSKSSNKYFSNDWFFLKNITD